MTPKPRHSGTRFALFFTVALAGLLVDIAVSLGVYAFLGVSLQVAAAVGFVTATFFNYFLNLRTTFADRQVSASLRNFAAYFLSVAAGLVVRLAAITILEWVLPVSVRSPLLILLLAAGLSILFNYTLANRFVFIRGERN